MFTLFRKNKEMLVFCEIDSNTLALCSSYKKRNKKGIGYPLVIKHTNSEIIYNFNYEKNQFIKA